MKAEIGIIGGSGLYSMPGFEAQEEALIDTPFGAPSDNFVLGKLAGRRVAFLARHGRGHRISPSELNFMLGYNVSVPSYVRQGMFSRSFDNDDLLPKIRKPVLITHGAADAIVKPAIVEQHKAAMPHAQIQLVPDVGHGVFWDEAVGFNERLHAFCERL